jgi:hypothetical protein
MFCANRRNQPGEGARNAVARGRAAREHTTISTACRRTAGLVCFRKVGSSDSSLDIVGEPVFGRVEAFGRMCGGGLLIFVTLCLVDETRRKMS